MTNEDDLEFLKISGKGINNSRDVIILTKVPFKEIIDLDFSSRTFHQYINKTHLKVMKVNGQGEFRTYSIFDHLVKPMDKFYLVFSSLDHINSTEMVYQRINSKLSYYSLIYNKYERISFQYNIKEYKEHNHIISQSYANSDIWEILKMLHFYKREPAAIRNTSALNCLERNVSKMREVIKVAEW